MVDRDRAATGERSREDLEPERRRRGGAFRQRGGTREIAAERGTDRRGRRLGRRRRDEEGAAGQLRHREARVRKERLGTGQESRLVRRRLEHDGLEKVLRGWYTGFEAREESLVPHALVRDVLVDQDEPLVTLGHEERIAVLAQEAKISEGRGRDVS